MGKLQKVWYPQYSWEIFKIPDFTQIRADATVNIFFPVKLYHKAYTIAKKLD